MKHKLIGVLIGIVCVGGIITSSIQIYNNHQATKLAQRIIENEKLINEFRKTYIDIVNDWKAECDRLEKKKVSNLDYMDIILDMNKAANEFKRLIKLFDALKESDRDITMLLSMQILDEVHNMEEAVKELKTR